MSDFHDRWRALTEVGIKLHRRWIAVLCAVLLGFVSGPALAQGKADGPAADASGAGASGSGATPPVSRIVPEAFRQASRVAIITIDGAIDGNNIMASSVERRLKEAARAGADAVVFDINTPGGAVNDVLRISNAIKSSPVPNTIAWINRDAYSGGAIIALACREIVVNDPASFGDAMPIGLDPFRGPRTVRDPELLKKVLPPLISDVVDSTRRHNEFFKEYRRDEYLTQAIVANDVELWLIRHKRDGTLVCIDRAELEILFPNAPKEGPTRLASVPGSSRPGSAGKAAAPGATATPGASVPAGSSQLAIVSSAVAANQTRTSGRPQFTAADRDDWEFVEKITDGSGPAVMKADDMRRLRFASNPVEVVGGVERLIPIRNEADLKDFLGATSLERLELSWSERLVVFLTNTLVRAVLLVVFLVALFVEMSHPGATVPGVVALLALVLMLGPSLLVGMAAWWEIGAILLGLLLLGLEVFVLPGFGIAGISGLVLMFVGLVATFTRTTGLFPNSAQDRSDLLGGATAVLFSMITASVIIYFIAKNFGSIPMFNRLVLKAPNVDDEADPGLIGALGEPDSAPARVGEVGTALTPLRPSGRVQIGDRLIDAVADIGFISAGASVRVTSVSEFRIGVEAVSKAAAEPPSRA